MKQSRGMRLFRLVLISSFLASGGFCGLLGRDGLAIWGRAIGGNGEDKFQMIEPDPDGGFFVAGKTLSFGGASEAWLMKLDAAGLIKWQKRYGGLADDDAVCLRCTSDRSLVMGGTTKSYGSGGTDIWIVKLDSQGRIKWQKSYGGTKDENAYDVRPTQDGGYIVAGNTWSYGSIGAAAWVLKLGPIGQIVWQKSFKIGDFADYPSAIQETSDGGYIMTGSTYNVGLYSMPWEDAWAVKLDAKGKIVWAKLLLGKYDDSAQAVIETTDGAYLLTGDTTSEGMGSTDVWVAKLSASGNVLWQKTYGGVNSDSGLWIQEIKKDVYILGGETSSSGKGGSDALAMKLNATGAIVWQKTYGGTEFDSASSIRPLKDGSTILSGGTKSFGSGDADGLVLLTTATGTSGSELTKNSNLIAKSAQLVCSNWSVSVSSTPGKIKTTKAKVSVTKAVNTRLFN